MTPRRLSLAEIAKEDRQPHDPQEPTPNEAVVNPPAQASASAAPQHPQPTEAPKKRNPKEDFVKMSVTVPPEMFEMLQDLSRDRRRSKLPYTLSELVREAIAAHFPERPQA